jgi:cellulose synthase/poly-beta-1,6-N-acetylglucosamine synthase-like glycosyltransferase
MATIFSICMTVLLLFFLALGSFRALLLLCAIPELWSHWRLADDEYFRSLIGADALPPISVVAMTYNEKDQVVQRIRALLDLEYPRHEVVMVNDGSTDGTMETLVQTFGLTRVSPAFAMSIPTQPVLGYYRSRLQPRLLIIDKERGGTADALNAGLSAGRYPYGLAVGANIIFESDALLRLARPFLLNKSVCAVAAVLRIANGGRMVNGRFVPVVSHRIGVGLQTVESLRTFLFERLGWNRIASNLIFPGSVALFLREHLLAVKGFRVGVETPGTDLAVRLQRYLTDRGVNARMLTISDPVAWTEFRQHTTPNRSRHRSQATRQRGLFQILREHCKMCLNPEYGALGMIALPYYWAKYIIAPFLELLGYVGLIIGAAAGVLTGSFVWAYLAAVLGFDMLLSVWTVVLETITDHRYEHRSDLVRLFSYALAEPFGYHQMTAWFRVRAFFITRSPRS